MIPAYNPRAEDLVRAVESVVSQTCRSWRCVVVDDGSSTELPPLEYDGVEVIRQPNRGVSAARNRGAATVGGDLIAFLDQDDHWHPEKLERQLAFVEHHGLAACDTDFEIVRDGVLIGTGYGDHGGDLGRLLSRAAIGLSTLVVRRDAFESVGGFDPMFPKVQDWVFALALLQAGFPLLRCPEVLCTYRLHGGNATVDYRRTYAEKMAVYDLYEALSPARCLQEAVRDGRRFTREVYAYQAIDAYRRDRRFSDLAWAAARRPSLVATAVGRKARGAFPGQVRQG